MWIMWLIVSVVVLVVVVVVVVVIVANMGDTKSTKECSRCERRFVRRVDPSSLPYMCDDCYKDVMSLGLDVPRHLLD